MNNRSNKLNLQKDERGLVSFFVTIIIMIILSLIVLGFSQVSRRDETESLNRVLSAESFYAAESGVNDAYSTVAGIINAASGNPLVTIPKQTQNCTNLDNPLQHPSYITSNSNILNSDSNTQYSCLLVNPNPSTLSDQPGPGQAYITALASSDPTNPITTLNINYSGANQNNFGCFFGSSFIKNPNASNIPSFLPNSSSQWASCAPVLMVDLVPTPASFQQSDLDANARSFFIYPSFSGGSASNPVNGKVYNSSCTFGPNTQCNFSLSGLNGGGQDNPYYMRLLYVYSSQVTYNITANGPHGQVSFTDGQVQIDSTGIAQNVLRRIQVNVAISPANTTPNYAIQTNSTICKRLSLGSGFYDENIPTPAPAEAAIPTASIVNTSSSVGIGSGASTTDPCNPLY